jgi:FMN reductase
VLIIKLVLCLVETIFLAFFIRLVKSLIKKAPLDALLWIKELEEHSLKFVGISGSIVGSKTKIAVEYSLNLIQKRYSEVETVHLHLGDLNIEFCDGRDYRDYVGDTKYLIHQMMSADALIIGTPTFQASIPGTLKNVFDLLPEEALIDKVVGIIATAGSPKHYLMVEQQLKPILSYMKATIVQKYVFIEDKDYIKKEITNNDVLSRLNRLVEDVYDTYNSVQFMKKEFA